MPKARGRLPSQPGEVLGRVSHAFAAERGVGIGAKSGLVVAQRVLHQSQEIPAVHVPPGVDPIEIPERLLVASVAIQGGGQFGERLLGWPPCVVNPAAQVHGGGRVRIRGVGRQ